MNKMHKFLTVQLIAVLFMLSGCTTLWPERWHSMMYDSTEQTRASNEKMEVDSQWNTQLMFQQALKVGAVDYMDYSKWWTDRMGVEAAKQSPPDISFGGSFTETVKDTLGGLLTPEGLAIGAGGGSLFMILLNMGIGYFRKRLQEKEKETVVIKNEADKKALQDRMVELATRADSEKKVLQDRSDAEKKVLQDKVVENDKYIIELEGKVVALKKERDTLRGQMLGQVTVQSQPIPAVKTPLQPEETIA